jgi:hypothetical protein
VCKFQVLPIHPPSRHLLIGIRAKPHFQLNRHEEQCQ